MRRIRREASENDIRKAAERLLWHQLKLMRTQSLKGEEKEETKQVDGTTNSYTTFIFEESVSVKKHETSNEKEEKKEEREEDDESIDNNENNENNDDNDDNDDDHDDDHDDHDDDDEELSRPLEDTSNKNKIENKTRHLNRSRKKNNGNEEEIFQLPDDLTDLTAAEIAQYPASMQYEIMQRMRDQLRQENRQEFLVASTDPEQYASVQLTNCQLKTYPNILEQITYMCM
ncbi:hypothetical protein RFI_29958 [Reticulomyxa filosa]|uniref:Uncharacterized protein n=1 Tax=Reticulomyxa filosa TaxID=46433 RepID=X6M208_RETFI|nr:hypothetical protein RFI_29958 [Reticulomyxa filosa]|eukprot:ETO07437.1 hypothetical protein RFI_29958 [Reticulomyxa filosa]